MHNQGRRILVVFDEASAIPDLIWERWYSSDSPASASVKSGNAHSEPMMSAFHPITTEQRTQFYVGSVPTAEVRVSFENFGAGGFKYGDPPASSGKTGRAVAVGSSPLGAVARSSRRTFKVVGPYLEKQLPTAWPRSFRAIRMRTHRAACKLSLGSAQ